MLFCAPCASALASDSSNVSLEPWQAEHPPIFELDSLDGRRIALADHRGKPVIVHFFATWCEPCIEELQSLERLAARRHGKDLIILAVDVGEVDARVRTFFRTYPVSFPVLLDRDRAASRAWQVMALPTSFILEPGLSPVLFVKGDIDWDTAEIENALDLTMQSAEGASAYHKEREE